MIHNKLIINKRLLNQSEQIDPSENKIKRKKQTKKRFRLKFSEIFGILFYFLDWSQTRCAFS